MTNSITNKTAQNPHVWPVKGVDIETRNAIKRAAKRANKALGEYFNTEIREIVQQRLSSKPTPPIQIEAVAQDIVTLKNENAELRKQQVAILKQLEGQPATLKEFLFGKPKSQS